MYIRDLHIRSFGLFHELRVTDLPGGLVVIQGQNEAGKTTLLDFMRFALTGPARNPDARDRWYVDGRENAGGELSLVTAQHGTVRLERLRDGQAILRDEARAMLPAELLDRLLCGVTRELYTSLYGISLSELQSVASLNSETIRHALFGAGFGMGSMAPRTLERALESRMDALFKPDGHTQPLWTSVKTWEGCGVRLSRCRETLETMADVQSRRAECAGKLPDLILELAAAEQQRHAMERRQEVWRQWEAWRLCGLRLSRLEDVPESMPEDAPKLLEAATLQLENARRQTGQAEASVTRARQGLAALHVDAALAAALPTLQALAEQKAPCRAALAALPRVLMDMERTTASLSQTLANLGPHWSMDRVRSVDRSLAVRERLAAEGEALRVGQAEHIAAGQDVDRARQNVEDAATAVADARKLLDDLPAPVTNLDAESRAELHDLLARVAEARKRLPQGDRELKNARMEQQRAMHPLGLMTSHNNAEGLQRMAEAQEEALSLAAKAAQLHSEAEILKAEAQRAREAETLAQKQFDRIRGRKDDLGDPSRTSLEGRRAALRRLRVATSLLPREEEALREAENACALHKAEAPRPDGNPWLLVLGLLLALAGGAHIFSLQVWGLSQFAVSPEFTLPLVPWHGYLVLLAGVTFMAAGLPRKNPDTDRHTLKGEQLHARVEAVTENLRHMREEIARQCALAGVDDTAPDTLDALENTLDRQQDHCATSERLDMELDERRDELEALKARAHECAEAWQRAHAEASSEQQHWHDTLYALGVRSNMVAPGSAEAFFARVETARAAVAAVSRLAEEIRDMEMRGPGLLAAARRLLPTENAPEHWTEETAEEAVRAALEACRLADMAEEERVRAGRNLQWAEDRLAREREAETHARDELACKAEDLERARNLWQDALRAVDLDVSLSPVTAQEALMYMDKAEELDAARARLADEARHHEAVRDALLLPLSELMERLGDRIALLNADHPLADDPLIRLDALLEAAAAARDTMAEDRQRSAALAEDEEALAAAKVAEAEAGQALADLLTAAHAAHGPDLLRRHAVWSERKALAEELRELHDSLWLSAEKLHLETGESTFTTQDFNAFLETFGSLDPHALQQDLQEVSARLETLARERARLEESVRELDERLSTLSGHEPWSAVRQDAENAAARVRSEAMEWARLALARQLLETARHQFEHECQPAVLRGAGTLLADITDGHWTALSRSLQDNTLSAATPSVRSVPVEQLSRGTREQLYLALRLAHVRRHAVTAAPLPLILDDILVNFDAERARGAARALAAMTRQSSDGPGHQVIFFTCHPHVTAMLRHSCDRDMAVFSLEQGKLSRV